MTSRRFNPLGIDRLWEVRVNGGALQLFSAAGNQVRNSNFSRNGQAIYFNSNRGSSSQIWKMAAAGGTATPVTRNGGFACAESADGQWLYYTRERGVAAIWRMPVAGGEETLFFEYRPNGHSRMWAMRNDGIYFARAEAAGRTNISFFNFSTRQEIPVFMTQHPLPVGSGGLTLSPDERFLLFPVIAQRGSDLMLMRSNS